MIEMTGKLFFFDLEGDVRKVSAPSLDCISDLISLLRNKYSAIDISQEDPEFWITDKKLGTRFRITSTEEINNGAVLEVIPSEKKSSDANQDWSSWLAALGPYRWNPNKHVLDSTLVSRLRGSRLRSRRKFGDRPSKSPRDRPLSGESNWKNGRSWRPDVRTCATHKKQRTLPNLRRQEDGTWTCVEHSRCRTGGSAGEEAGDREQVCSIHGKSRTLKNLEKSWDGSWICLKESRCIVASKDSDAIEGYGKFSGPSSRESGGLRRERKQGRGGERGSRIRGGLGTVSGSSQDLYGGGRFKLRSNRRALKCIIHGKTRTATNLRSDGCGGLVCLPSSQCR